MSERDKFLTEAMGECWHEFDINFWHLCRCIKCGKGDNYIWQPINNNFSTWDGFGKLWEWAQGQEWWTLFCAKLVYTPESNPEAIDYDGLFPEGTINHDRFADALYKFLKEKA